MNGNSVDIEKYVMAIKALPNYLDELIITHPVDVQS
jgi:hypothetical protein